MKKLSYLFVFLFLMMGIKNLNAQNNCLDFDGTDDYVDVSGLSTWNDATAFTVEAWIYTANGATDMKIVGKTTGDHLNGFSMNVISNRLYLELWLNNSSDYSTASTATFNNNEWTHIAMTWVSGGSIKGYINGVEVIDVTNTASSNLGNTDNLIIGAGAWAVSSFNFNGKMDEVRVWDDVRTEIEIRQGMYREIGVTGETNLKAYYKLNETTGTTADDATSGNYDGALTNYGSQSDYWQTSSAFFGPKYCLDFDGTNDYVDCGTIDLSGSSITLECWVKADAFQGTDPYISSLIGTEAGTDNINTALLRLGDADISGGNKVQFVLQFGSTGNLDQVKLTSTTELATDKWYHIAGVYDGAKMKLYINGVLDAEVSQTGSFVSNEAFYIATKNGTERYLNGSIDEVRVWSDARTVTEIQDNMCTNLTGIEANLTRYFNCDLLVGSVLPSYYLGGTVYNGTINALETGTSTATGTNTLTNTSASWTVDALIGKTISITTSGKEQNRTISSNTATEITVSANWDPTLVAIETFNIFDTDACVPSTAFNTWLNTNTTTWATTTNWSRGSVPVLTDNIGVVNYGGTFPNLSNNSSYFNHVVIGTNAEINNDLNEIYNSIDVSGNFINNGTFADKHPMYFSGTKQYITGSSNTTFKSFTINSGSDTYLAAGNNLTISGKLSNSCTFTVNSDATGTGSLIVEVEANGDVVMQRYLAAATWGTWDDGWHFLSSPVPDYPIETNFTVTPAADYDFYAWSEKYNVWVNYSDGTSPTFSAADVNGSNDFELGHGYMAAYKTTSTKNFTGSINVSNVAISGLTLTAPTTGDYHSWHLLGNPFTSGLTWDAGWTTNNIGGIINIWKEDAKSYTSIAATTGGIIPATNGFMVQATVANASLTIPKSKRTHGGTFYKSASFPIIKLKANNIDNPSYQESQILFNPNSTVGYESAYDGDFLPGYAPLFYSKIDDMPMAVNSMPNVEEATSIPFTFIKNEGLNFSIEMYEVENMDLTVWLFDNKLNKDHNLTNNPVYIFTAFENDNPERFNIHFSPLGVDEPITKPELIQIWSANRTINVFNNNNYIGDIRVVNMFGQTILTPKLNGNQNQQIAINAPTGYYVINIITNKGVVVNKKLYLR